MGGNMAKAPLVAVLYAALFSFIGPFLPFSENYRLALNTFSVSASLSDRLMPLAYCLFICLCAALAFSWLSGRGAAALLPILPAFWGLQWIVPLLQQFMTGEVTAVMTTADTLFFVAQGAAATLLTLLLCAMLMKPSPENPNSAKSAYRYKLRILNLSIMLIVLPVFYFILHFVAGYFLGWKNDAARAYYNGGNDGGFFDMLINMLISHLRYGGIALLRGLLMALFGIPLLTRMPAYRSRFIILHAALCLSGALYYLLPTPLMPAGVRVTHMIAYGVIHLVYGGVSGLLLHTCYARLAVKTSELPRPAQQERPDIGQKAVAAAARR